MGRIKKKERHGRDHKACEPKRAQDENAKVAKRNKKAALCWELVAKFADHFVEFYGFSA